MFLRQRRRAIVDDVLDGDVTALADSRPPSPASSSLARRCASTCGDTGDRLVGTATVVERDAPALANVVVVKS